MKFRVLCLFALAGASSIAATIPVTVSLDQGKNHGYFSADLEIDPANPTVGTFSNFAQLREGESSRPELVLPTTLSHELLERALYLFQHRFDPYITSEPQRRSRGFGFGDDENDDDDFGFSLVRRGFGGADYSVQRPFNFGESESEDYKSVFTIYLGATNQLKYIGFAKRVQSLAGKLANEDQLFGFIGPEITTRTSLRSSQDCDITLVRPWGEVLAQYLKSGSNTLLIDYSLGWRPEITQHQSITIPVRIVGEAEDTFDVVLETELRANFLLLQQTPNTPLPVTFPPGITAPRSYVDALREILPPKVVFGPPKATLGVYRIKKIHGGLPQSAEKFEKAVAFATKRSGGRISVPSSEGPAEDTQRAYPTLAFHSFVHSSLLVEKREFSYIDLLQLGQFIHPDRLKDCGWLVSRKPLVEEEKP